MVPKPWTDIAPAPQEICRKEGVFENSTPHTGELFTDGSGGIHTADPRIRRCGWAVVMAQRTPQQSAISIGEMWGTLGGPQQTVPRAELYAVRMAVKHTAGPITIFSDCKYVVDGYHKGRDHTVQGSNGDLWLELWQACQGREGTVTMAKVKAHTSEEEVQAGLISRYHQAGNKLSDEYAGKGSQLHQVPEDVVAQITDIDKMATCVLLRLQVINMACAKEFHNLKSRRQEAPGQAVAPLQAQRPRSLAQRAQEKLTLLGHKINISHVKLACTQCYQSRPVKEALAWVKEGQCPGPPAPSTGSSGAPRPPTTHKQGHQRFGQGTVHETHRTTLIKGLLFCWGCGGFSVNKVRALAKPCAPLKCKRARLTRVRRGLPPTSSVQWPEP